MKYFYAIFLAILVSACGSGSNDLPTAQVSPVYLTYEVEQRGDSIKNQAGQTLEKYLPKGSKVTNFGLDGQRAWDMVVGRYGSLPVNMQPSVYYSFDFGANECLQNTGTQFFKDNIEHTIFYMKGFRTIIIAPWKITNPSGGCDVQVESYRQVVVDLIAKYKKEPGYNVTMPALDINQDNIGEGIHLGQGHTDLRAELESRAIYSLK